MTNITIDWVSKIDWYTKIALLLLNRILVHQAHFYSLDPLSAGYFYTFQLFTLDFLFIKYSFAVWKKSMKNRFLFVRHNRILIWIWRAKACWIINWYRLKVYFTNPTSQIWQNRAQLTQDDTKKIYKKTEKNHDDVEPNILGA